MDKFNRNRNLIVFLGVMLIFGMLSGIIFAKILNSNDQTLVTSYLDSFLSNIRNNSFNYQEVLISTLLNNFIYIVFIWLLGISIIGIPIIIFMFFSKSFVLGFIISAFVCNYNVKGLLYSFLYLFPHQFITLFAYLFLCLYALKVAFKIINSIVKKEMLNFSKLIRFYFKILIIVLVIVVFTILYEIYLVPYLIKLVI